MCERKVSIIMPCYNSAKTIIKSINSVLAQKYENFELIICDDSSTDETLSLIKSVKDPRVIVVNNLYQKGAAGARNTALDVINGYYVAFLDSDDFWSESKLINQITFMEKYKCDFSYGNYYIIRKGDIIGKFNAASTISYIDLLKKCDIGCLTVVISREVLGNMRFPYGGKEDYRLWLNILEKNKRLMALNCNEADSYYTLSPFSVSSNKIKEFKRQWSIINSRAICFRMKLYCIIYYAISGIIKHFIKYRFLKK